MTQQVKIRLSYILQFVSLLKKTQKQLDIMGYEEFISQIKQLAYYLPLHQAV